jgi:sulfite reductase alpha subunit-like flavoprotein
LIFGCRKDCDALYHGELKKLESEMSSFQYIPTFSREEPSPDKKTGYVHSVYEELLQKEKSDAKFYLCGWKNMIDEAKQRITGLGYDRKDIHLELYG